MVNMLASASAATKGQNLCRYTVSETQNTTQSLKAYTGVRVNTLWTIARKPYDDKGPTAAHKVVADLGS